MAVLAKKNAPRAHHRLVGRKVAIKTYNYLQQRCKGSYFFSSDRMLGQFFRNSRYFLSALLMSRVLLGSAL